MAQTFLELINTVRDRYDIENSQHITNAVIGAMLKDSLNKLYNETIKTSELWNVTTLTFTTDSNGEYQLPYNFYKMEQLYRVFGDNKYLVNRLNRKDLEYSFNDTCYLKPSGYFLKRASDGYATLSIFPKQANTFELWYYSSLPTFADDDEVIIGSPDSPWLELAVLDTIVKICEKDGTDASLYLNEYQKTLTRVREESAAQNIGQNEPPSLVNNWITRFNRRDCY